MLHLYLCAVSTSQPTLTPPSTATSAVASYIAIASSIKPIQSTFTISKPSITVAA
jgi:hypothetical protein